MSGHPTIKLTYFGIEGAAEKVRLALVLSGIPFEDDRIGWETWPTLKPTTKYGQLPIMTIDGGEPIAQSEAMLRYVGRLGGLYPPEKALAIDEAIGLIGDLTRAWTPGFYMAMRPTMFGRPEDWQKTEEGQAAIKQMREAFVATELPKYLGYFQDMMGDHLFLVGNEPTIADCVLVPTLRNFTKGHLDHVPVTCLDTHPKVTAYIARFMALPKVQAYYDALKK